MVLPKRNLTEVSHNVVRNAQLFSVVAGNTMTQCILHQQEPV